MALTPDNEVPSSGMPAGLPGIELKGSWRRQERRICLGSYANEMLRLGTLATFQTTDLEANQIVRDENDVKFLF